MKILCFHNIFLEPAISLSQKINYPYYTIKNFKPQHDDILIIFGGHQASKILFTLKEVYNNKFIILQSEQLNTPCFNLPFYKELLKHSIVFDWSYSNMQRLKHEYKIYCKGLFVWTFLEPKQIQQNIIETKSFDIFFAGVRTNKRESIINKLKNINPKLKWFVDLDYRLTDYKKLTSILSRCRYVINIPTFENSALETHRIIKALHCKCQILSEPSFDKQLTIELEPYVHFGELTELIKNINTIKDKKDINDYIKDYEDKKIKEFKNICESM